MDTAPKTTWETWDQVVVGSRVKRDGRYYTITAEEVDDHGMIHRHVVPDQPVELEFNNGEFDIAGYADDPVGWDIQPPKEGTSAVSLPNERSRQVGRGRVNEETETLREAELI